MNLKLFIKTKQSHNYEVKFFFLRKINTQFYQQNRYFTKRTFTKKKDTKKKHTKIHKNENIQKTHQLVLLQNKHAFYIRV